MSLDFDIIFAGGEFLCTLSLRAVCSSNTLARQAERLPVLSRAD